MGKLHGAEVALGTGPGRHRAPGGRHGPEVVRGSRPGRHHAPGKHHGSEVALDARRLPNPDGPHGPRWFSAQAPRLGGDARSGQAARLRGGARHGP